MIGSLARSVKDGALALSLKAFLNDRFRDYGDVQDCEVDTKAGRLVVHVLLRGEREPVTARIERYEFVDTAEGRMVVLHSLSSSREWIGRLLTRFFSGKRYKLPAAVLALL